MKVYSYDLQGKYTGESVADESPLEKGVYLIPADATNIKPPITEANEVAVFNGQVWNIQAVVSNEPTEEEIAQRDAEIAQRAEAKAAVLSKLGITAEEVTLLFS